MGRAGVTRRLPRVTMMAYGPPMDPAWIPWVTRGSLTGFS